MRGMTMLLATALTLGYGFAAQAAMTADRAETLRRIAGPDASLAPTPDEAATRVWYGGMLAPVTVEVSVAHETPARCALT
jgi:hypothetical protein